MTLKEWLADNGLSHSDFARMIDRTPEAVRRYALGERIPDKATMPVIADKTAGAVTANDFFGIASSSLAETNSAAAAASATGKAGEVSAPAAEAA